MRGQRLLRGPALATLACAILAGCTAGGTSAAAHRTAPSSSRPAASPQATGRIGSPGNPLVLSCAEESFAGGSDPAPQQPQPGDLAVGPLFIVNGKRLATADPAGYGSHGSYKVPLAILRGFTATVTIGVQARGQVVIDNPYAPAGGVVSASYHPCPGPPGFFAQGFAFTHGQTRGCVPLDVKIGHQPQVRHVTLSLFAGPCPS
jgi:hypothetical protein